MYQEELMVIDISSTSVECGKRAATSAAKTLNKVISEKDQANLILATGASQFHVLSQLVKEDVDWTKVTVFHLDEYIGLPDTHPASFRKYLKERFVKQVDGLKEFNYVIGDAEVPLLECQRLGAIIKSVDIDLACVGIGENGHLAFNDPPADFATETPYIVVELDDACRRQQMGEGWFETLEDVPRQAISMSINRIMLSKSIICTVPDTRKAEAVKAAIEGPVVNTVPASILQRHPLCSMFLDDDAAALLDR